MQENYVQVDDKQMCLGSTDTIKKAIIVDNDTIIRPSILTHSNTDSDLVTLRFEDGARMAARSCVDSHSGSAGTC